jgi:hypothetical protein
LEDIGSIEARAEEAHRAGLLAVGSQNAITLTLADLEIAFELLEGACQKLHYLARRSEFQAQASYLGDEADLLAFYLDTGFNIGESEFNGEVLFLTGMSKELDPYFIAKSDGRRVKKPSLRLTKWWRAMLNSLEARGAPGWSDVGRSLLNVPALEQDNFERQFQKIRVSLKRRARKRRTPDNVVMITGPPQRRDAFVAWAYAGLDRTQRNTKMDNIARGVLSSEKLHQLVFVGVDLGLNDYPYSVIAALKRDPVSGSNSA